MGREPLQQTPNGRQGVSAGIWANAQWELSLGCLQGRLLYVQLEVCQPHQLWICLGYELPSLSLVAPADLEGNLAPARGESPKEERRGQSAPAALLPVLPTARPLPGSFGPWIALLALPLTQLKREPTLPLCAFLLLAAGLDMSPSHPMPKTSQMTCRSLHWSEEAPPRVANELMCSSWGCLPSEEMCIIRTWGHLHVRKSKWVERTPGLAMSPHPEEACCGPWRWTVVATVG